MTAPIRVRREALERWLVWEWDCRLCLWWVSRHDATWSSALEEGLAHLAQEHGCPQHAITGERCDSACIHCGGRQWVAA